MYTETAARVRLGPPISEMLHRRRQRSTGPCVLPFPTVASLAATSLGASARSAGTDRVRT